MSHSIVNAIAPVRDRKGLTHADRHIVADVLTWDTQHLVSSNEVETIAIAHDIVEVKLTDNRAIPLHVETFHAIRRQQLEQQGYYVHYSFGLVAHSCLPLVYQ